MLVPLLVSLDSVAELAVAIVGSAVVAAEPGLTAFAVVPVKDLLVRALMKTIYVTMKKRKYFYSNFLQDN